MNNNENYKRNDRNKQKRGRNNNRSRQDDKGSQNTQVDDNKPLLTNENRPPVELTQSHQQTTNLDPLCEGYRMPRITLFDAKEKECELGDDKTYKLYVSIPTLQDKELLMEIKKMEPILQEFPSLHCYLITNEPVFTQTRVTQGAPFTTFSLVSDFKNREFARNTGTYIYETQSLMKAIFILDKSDRIVYTRYMEDTKEIFDINEINNALADLLQ